MSVIKLKNVNKDFGKGSSRVHILDNVNFSADNGQLILILGPSGSGKSTFLTIAGSLQTPTSGKVEVNGKEIHNMTSKQQEKLRLNDIGFILQSYNLIPYLKVKDQFKLVDRIRKSGNLSKERLDHLFDILGIANLKDKYPSELSGGQLQRVAIARALYTNPKIILADEPTAALDSERVNEVGKLLHKLAKEENKAVIVVTHDLRLTQYADKIYDIIDGKLTLRK